MDEKFKKAAEVICKQGMVQFPVGDTAIAIVVAVVGNNAEELDLIDAFRDKPSQTAEQLSESSGFAADKVEQLATSLAQKGLVFNQPSSSGVMIYRLLPLMLVGVMEYKFMVPLTGSQEEKDLARLFEKLLKELRSEIQGNYDALMPLFYLRQIGPPHGGPGFCQENHQTGSLKNHAGGRGRRIDPQGLSPRLPGIQSRNQHLQLLQGLLRYPQSLAQRHPADDQFHLPSGGDR
jgi:hypothetical protein